MRKFKCCRTCDNCHLDLRAIRLCGVLLDQCSITKEHVLHPYLYGWRCRMWEGKDGKKSSTLQGLS